MLMVISPAKALNLAPPPERTALTTAQMSADTTALAEVTARLTARKLKALMGISDKLAQLNVARFAAFDPASDDGLQAVFAFNGDVYTGLKARELSDAIRKWYGSVRRVELVEVDP